MSNPVAAVEIQAKSTGLAAQLREARATFGRFADSVKSQLGRAFAGSREKGGLLGKRGTLDNVTTGIGQGVGQQLTGKIEDAARSVFDFSDKLTRLQITADATPESMEGFARTVRSASDATGISKVAILDAATAYVALTGDMETARASTDTWARVAQATNTTIADISSTAAAMSQQMKIGPAEMETAFATLAIQGKKGAIELKDLAGYLNVIAPQWAMFGRGTGAGGVRELGAALQIVKRGFGGDAAETITGLQSLLTSLTKNSSRFEQFGIKMFDVDKDGTKHMRNALEIVSDIGKSKLMKDPTALEKAFGRVEAYRAFLQLKENKGALDDLIKSSDDATVIQRDLQTYMTSSAGRVVVSWERLKNKIAEVFTPERIQAFADAIESLADKIGPVVSAVGKIGDALGATYNLGRKIRGAISGNNAIDLGENTANLLQLEKMHGGSAELLHQKFREHLFKQGEYDKSKSISDAEIDQIFAAAHKRQAEIAEANATARDIMGSEADEKSTPDSVRKAVFATYSANDYERFIGEKYTKAAGVDPDKQQQVVRDAFKEALSPLLAEIKDMNDQLAKGTEVKVGAEPVVNATKNAATHRRGVAK